MKKLIAPVLAAGLLLSGCGIEDAKGIYKESINITSGYLEAATSKWQSRPVGVCELNESELFDFVGGLSAGTALTGWVAGDALVWAMTSMGPMLVLMPAVATGVVASAATAATAYAGVKGYCAGM
jgi:hypothetical protein